MTSDGPGEPGDPRDPADVAWVGPMAETYDRCLGPAVFAPPAADLAQRTLLYRGGARRVLELAAGTGILTAGLVEALPEAEITATDLNPAMVEFAAKRVSGATWQVADATDLAYADASFDLVVSQFGVMFFPDKVTAFREVRRVLTPGGLFLFNVWDTLDTHDFETALTEVLAELLPEDPPDFFERVPHGYADPARIRADLQAAGLMFKGEARNVLVGRAPSAAVLAEGYCLGTPLRFQLQALGDLSDLVPRVTRALMRRLGSGAVEGRLGEYVVRAVRPD